MNSGRAFLLFSLILFLIMLPFTACGKLPFSTTQVTVVVPQTVEVTRLVERSIVTIFFDATITPLETPSKTIEPVIATPLASSNADASLSVNGELLGGLSGWCMPLNYGKPDGTDFGRVGIPKYARPGYVDNKRNVMHIPGDYCTLVFHLKSVAVVGATVQVKQVHNKITFYTKPLIVSGADPNVGYVHLEHSYIVNPPLWTVVYLIEVIDPDGTVRWSGEVWFERTQPEPCWDGSTVDPVTLLCPKYDW